MNESPLALEPACAPPAPSVASSSDSERLFATGELTAPPSRDEKRLFAAWLGFAAAIRVVGCFRSVVDSDEPQHLHVAWGWAQGFVQHRDFSDNHAPLFHILTAPLMRLLGDQADLIWWMRLSLLPVTALLLWGVYRLGRALFSARTGAWAAAMAAFSPHTIDRSLEFRTDNLWAAAWVITLAVAVTGRFTARRALATGLLLGVSFAVSMKTSMLAGALIVAVIVAAFMTRPRIAGRTVLATGAALLIGVVAIPGAITAWYAAHAGLDALIYDVFTYNTTADAVSHHRWDHIAIVLGSLPVAWFVARRMARSAPSPEIATRRVIIFGTAVVYAALLWGFWPLVVRQSWLPVDPVACVFLPTLVVVVATRLRVRRPSLALASVTCLCVAMALPRLHPWLDGTAASRATVRAAVDLSLPTEPVIDAKGEFVVRRRAFVPVLETIARQRIRDNPALDTLAEAAVRERVCIVGTHSDRFPAAGAAFLNAHYILVGPQVRVPGMIFNDPSPNTDLTFEAVIPTTYSVITDEGAFDGTLDGTPFDGPRALDPGMHRITPGPLGSAGRRLAIVWSRAIERGYSPFARKRGRS